MGNEGKQGSPWRLGLFSMLLLFSAFFWTVPISYVFLQCLKFAPSLLLMCILAVALSLLAVSSAVKAVWTILANGLGMVWKLREATRNKRCIGAADLADFHQAHANIHNGVVRHVAISIIAMVSLVPFAIALSIWHDVQTPRVKEVEGKVAVEGPQEQLQHVLDRVARRGVFTPIPFE